MEKNKVMMIIIIILLVVLIAAIGAVSFFAFRIMNANTNEEAPPASTVIIHPVLSEKEITKIALADAFKTNLLTGADGVTHYISVEVGIGINNTIKTESDELIALITEDYIVQRDIINDILHRTTAEEITMPGGYDNLKQEILSMFQETYNSNLIVKIYFSNIVTQ